VRIDELVNDADQAALKIKSTILPPVWRRGQINSRRGDNSLTFIEHAEAIWTLAASLFRPSIRNVFICIRKPHQYGSYVACINSVSERRRKPRIVHWGVIR
jgi:hypothetical protein